jgi:uncharacterized protein
MENMQSVASSASYSSTETAAVPIHSGALTAHVCRLPPGSDFVTSLQDAALRASRVSSTSSVVVLTCVGSLSSLTLRMANATPESSSVGDANKATPTSTFRTWNEPLEIVSLVGTIAVSTATISTEPKSMFHLHIAVSDDAGNAYGGHLVNGAVHTTVELALGTISSVSFDRVHDPNTGYRELVVSSVSVPNT